MSILHIGGELKKEVDAFMSSILEQGELMAPSDIAFRKFRKNVLDSGNALLRRMNEKLTASKVVLPVSHEQLKEMGKHGK